MGLAVLDLQRVFVGAPRVWPWRLSAGLAASLAEDMAVGLLRGLPWLLAGCCRDMPWTLPWCAVGLAVTCREGSRGACRRTCRSSRFTACRDKCRRMLWVLPRHCHEKRSYLILLCFGCVAITRRFTFIAVLEIVFGMEYCCEALSKIYSFRRRSCNRERLLVFPRDGVSLPPRTPHRLDRMTL